MKTIIAGSRTGVQFKHLLNALGKCGWRPSAVISGCAPGADMIGEYWARISKVPVHRFPADWDRFGRSAGYRRNVEMAMNAEALIALWDGQSKGTAHMIEQGRRRGLRVWVEDISTRDAGGSAGDSQAESDSQEVRDSPSGRLQGSAGDSQPEGAGLNHEPRGPAIAQEVV